MSPNLVAYWRDGFRILNFATRLEVRATPLVAQVLAMLGDWRSSVDVAKMLGLDGDVEVVDRLFTHLSRASILRCSNTPPDRRDREMAAWGPWNPAAGLFHALTTGVTYLDNDLPRTRRLTAWPAEPPIVTRKDVRIPLAYPQTSDAFSRVLLARRTWRRFSRTPLERDQAGALLWLTAGVQAWLHTPRGERLALKTSPSGGARHPVEVYVLAKHVRRVPSGLYRYDGVRNELVSIGPPARQNRTYLPRQDWYEHAALIVFFCAQFGKTLARYAYPRAYRAVLLEAGHLCQTFCLTATWLGLAPFSTLALDDRRIESDLGLDGIARGVLYAAGVGMPCATGTPSAPRDARGIDIRNRHRGKTPDRRGT